MPDQNQQLKLVRAKLLPLVKSAYKVEPYSFAMHKQYAIKKLIEECEEVVNCETRNELIEELGDLQEVINVVASLNSIPLKMIEEKRLNKLEKFGGFDQLIVMPKTNDC